MPKYSVGGGGGGGDGGTCELCGTATEDLHTATVEGATLSVCADCASLGEQSGKSGGGAAGSGGGRGQDEEGPSRQKRAAQNAARALDAGTSDSSHWEEHGTNYDADQLPYLVSDYGERVLRARQDAGFQREELAAEMDIDENDLLAVEQGRATEASVGGSLIRALEAELDIDLVDE